MQKVNLQDNLQSSGSKVNTSMPDVYTSMHDVYNVISDVYIGIPDGCSSARSILEPVKKHQVTPNLWYSQIPNL